ncbi:MAG: SGNH/GDSL hydrolase family protein [Lachnospiraceae bacterium]
MKGQIKDKVFIATAVLTVLLMIVVAGLTVNIISLREGLKKNVAEQTTVGDSGIEIYLPDTYYAASGLTMEIYNSQITNQGTHISEYNVLWECEVGECLNRKFSVEATDDILGDHELKVSIFDNAGNLLAEKKSTLSVVEAKQEAFSILAIGDSLSANGALYMRLQEHLGNQMICNGTRGYEGFLTEARLGFSASDYLNETSYDLEEGEECHPFYNPDKKRFDWNYYKKTTGFDPDVIQLFLGTNALTSGDENAENIVKIVKLIRKDDKKIPIYLVNTIYQADQNGIGSWKNRQGAVMFRGEYKQERDLYNFRLMTYLADALKDDKYTYLVPAAISVDSENVFDTEERPVNPYSEKTETYATDPVHPTAAGYYQIADTIYSTMCGTME